MSRIFHRAAAIVAGLALPFSAFALVAPANIDKEFVDEAYAAIVGEAAAQASIATIEVPSTAGAKGEATRPEFTTNGCCQWVYWNGMWYCFPC